MVLVKQIFTSIGTKCKKKKKVWRWHKLGRDWVLAIWCRYCLQRLPWINLYQNICPHFQTFTKGCHLWYLAGITIGRGLTPLMYHREELSLGRTKDLSESPCPGQGESFTRGVSVAPLPSWERRLTEVVTSILQSWTLEIQFPKFLINQSIHCHCDPRTVQTLKVKTTWEKFKMVDFLTLWGQVGTIRFSVSVQAHAHLLIFPWNCKRLQCHGKTLVCRFNLSIFI